VKLNQQNIFVRFILRTIDVIASFLGGYWHVKWNQDPYRKATEAQKRESALFMVFCPIAFLVLFGNRKYFDSWVDSMMYGHHSIIWFYLAFIGIVCLAVFIMPKIAQKIPLFISVPVAVAMWLIFGWFSWTHFWK
jgi:magnesium-transporting ATPase (P-type)